MDAISLEKANYVIAHYSNLLTLPEKAALRHLRSNVKLENVNDDKLTGMYYRAGWLSDNLEILNHLNNGYLQFIVSCSQRILKDNPGEVYAPFVTNLPERHKQSNADVAVMIGIKYTKQACFSIKVIWLIY